MNCLALTMDISAQPLWNLHKGIIFPPWLLLIVLVCKSLSIPVYPEWWNDEASHVAKGCSKRTGDGPYLQKECETQKEQMSLLFLEHKLQV